METTKTFKFSNGDRVRELVTGFTGVITGTCYYLTGCNQYLITAKAKDSNTEPQALWYDEGRLEFVGEGVTEDDVKASDNGCDISPIQGKRGS